MVVVDSSVWVEAARRNGELEYKVGLESLLAIGAACYCGPILLEVLGGARMEERKTMASFFEDVSYRAMEDQDWDQAKHCAWRLRDKGHTVPANDILIGSLSLAWNCRVYAKDRHFETMRDVLEVRLYTPGYGGSYQPDR